jgi:cyclophilin family peptidyl-prolyl cis-trans isomerase
MPSKARDRQLAKIAERRREERKRARRRRRIALGVGGAITGALVIALGMGILQRDDTTSAGESPTPTVSPSHQPKNTKPPKQTGTVTAKVKPPSTVACGASVPAAADTPKPQYDHAPTVDQALAKNTEYTAVLQTSCGDITIQLDRTAAPQTVASFVFLAQHRFFDGTFFHRVVDSIDVVQGGDPTGTGGGGPGYTIPDELSGSEHYAPGTVAMAKSQAPNSGGSQFFLITGPEGANLDANPAYTIFGKITDGLDVAKKINALMPKRDGSYDGAPSEAVYIDRVTIQASKTPKPSPSPSG